MTELTLLRHAQSKAQTGEQPWLDPDLSEFGQRQARSLNNAFSDRRFKLAVISPLLRTRRTFELARIRAERIQFDSRLVEVTLNRGRGYDYRTILPYPTPGYGEPDVAEMWTSAAGIRVASLLAELRGRTESVLLVGHCGIFHVMRLYLSGDPIDGEPVVDESVRSKLMDNAAISTAELGTTPRGDRIVEWNRPAIDRSAVASGFL